MLRVESGVNVRLCSNLHLEGGRGKLERLQESLEELSDWKNKVILALLVQEHVDLGRRAPPAYYRIQRAK